MHKKKVIVTLALAAIFSIASVSEGVTLRVYLMGNSLTDNIDHSGLIQLAEEGGHTQIHGSHRIPGAPMPWIYDHPDNGFSHNPYGRWGKAFGNYQWDAVSVQPFLRPLSTDLETIGKFMDTAKVLSPDVQFYIYAQWPNEYNGDYAQIWLQDVSPWIENGTGGFITPQRTKMYFETLADTVRKVRTDMKPILISPVGHVFYVLDQKIKAGLIEGHSSIWEFVTGTHVNNVGSYIAGCTYFATLYGESPVGLPVVEPYRQSASSKSDLPITNDLARIIQESVWEVVATHPMTGVTSTELVKIVSPIIEDAVANNAYRFLFLPGFGKYPYRWDIVSGTLPSGLSLAESGKISGTTNAVGNHTFTVRVTDANGGTAQKQFTLEVAADIEPAITSSSPLPDASKAAYYKHQFESSGGNGTIVWEFADENYPPGMELSRSGLLTGSSGVEGTYTFTIRAFDSDASNPDTVEKEFVLRVGPATQPYATARLVDGNSAPDMDGNLDESYWDLTNTVEKVVSGSSHNNTVTFDAVWTDARSGNLYIAVKVQDASVTEGDRIVVYIDALNNREDTYNWDDRKTSFKAADGSKVGDESIGSTRWTRVSSALTSDGYTMEILFDWRNLGLNDVERLNRVIGFDIANIDVDEGSNTSTEVVWQGTARNSVDPSEFGALLLSDGPTGAIKGNHISPVAQQINIVSTSGGLVKAFLPGSQSWDVAFYTLNGKEIARHRVNGIGQFKLSGIAGNATIIARIKNNSTVITRKILLNK